MKVRCLGAIRRMFLGPALRIAVGLVCLLEAVTDGVSLPWLPGSSLCSSPPGKACITGLSLNPSIVIFPFLHHFTFLD